MEIPIKIFLHEDAAGGGEGCVSHDKKRLSVVREGFLMVNRPLSLGILVGEQQKGSGKIRKSWYELLIQVAESDKGSDCFYVDRGSPVFDGLEFSGVHFNRSG